MAEQWAAHWAVPRAVLWVAMRVVLWGDL